MPSALTELCINLQSNTDKLEEELKRNIVECHKLLIDRKATETKLALEKAKDFHYKEVLDILKDIVISIKKIIFHEGKIRKLNDESNVSSDELKRYSYVQRQVQAFSNNEEVVTKREKRRVASEISVESLDAWELYLEKKAEEEKAVQVETTVVPKRKAAGNRRKKKFVSSTFNNFLEGKTGNGPLDSISENDRANLTDRLARIDSEDDLTSEINYENGISGQRQRRLEDIPASSLSSFYESETDDDNFKDGCTEDQKDQRQNLSTLDIIESLNQEYCLETPDYTSKPKIVEVIYKKKLD